ncbi:MAG: mevalonate kinase [Anaerolineales bacterium]
MPAISASAPGKVILFGEHAVVYGQPAIAVPVNQVRARAIVSARPDRPSGWVSLQAPDIGLEACLEELPAGNPLSLAINSVFEATNISRIPAMAIRITSTIPIAAGLGSGAAVSVAIIRALSEFLGQPLPDERVSILAYEVEKLHHGTPSGIDNTVITYGKPVYFARTTEGETGQVDRFNVARPFTILIGDSGVPSPTAVTVGDVRSAWQADSVLYERLFASTGAIVNQARQAIENGDIAALGPLMDENQDLLVKMGVSSAELDHLVRAARQAGAYGAKLSGGGRGGNMIALVTRGTAEQIAEAIISAGATNTIVTEVKS